ncbi:MAG: hypothetical protein Q4G05_05885 [Clostridia bacterium]|nr:hypothetical protein [Clostridia bacterium]
MKTKNSDNELKVQNFEEIMNSIFLSFENEFLKLLKKQEEKEFDIKKREEEKQQENVERTYWQPIITNGYQNVQSEMYFELLRKNEIERRISERQTPIIRRYRNTKF